MGIGEGEVLLEAFETGVGEVASLKRSPLRLVAPDVTPIATFATSVTSYVIQVVGDKNPFINEAFTLSRSAWNCFRVYIQLVNAFPRSDARRRIIIELIRDLVLHVSSYRYVWKRLGSDHRYLMVNYVCSFLFPHCFWWFLTYAVSTVDVEGGFAGTGRVEDICSPHCQGPVLQGLHERRKLEGTPGPSKVVARREPKESRCLCLWDDRL